jgi:hypothetical protein
MSKSSLQLTIRGLDAQTKVALVKKANQQGLSLNRYALKALQRSAGLDDQEVRYQVLKQFLNEHAINQTRADKEAFDEAIKWSDETSLKKQRQDHDASF